MSDCQHIVELLPWLLNGTLEAGEREQAREHLAQCQQCRREVDETVFALAMRQRHVPAEALVDYAFDRPVAGIDPELLRLHVDICRECSEQVEMARASRRWAETQEANVAPIVTREKKIWLWPALALASLVVILALGAWLWTWRQARNEQARLTAQRQELSERVANLEAENQRLRQAAGRSQADSALAELQAKVKELTAPQINVLMFDLYPSNLTRRADQSEINEIAIPRGARSITLILNSSGRNAARAANLEIADAQGAVVWRAAGLARHPTNDFTISLPAAFLPPGNYTINLYRNDRRVKIESYPIRILTAGGAGRR